MLTINNLLSPLRLQREEATARRDALVREMQVMRQQLDAGNGPSDDEVRRIVADKDTADREIRRLDVQIEDLERERGADDEADRQSREVHETDAGRRFRAAQRAAGGARVGATEVYRRGDQHGNSWVRDMVAMSLRADQDAAARLRDNNRVVAGELHSRALTTTDGAGGDFVPPLYVLQDMAELARAARPTADRVRREALPAGTDSISLPKVATGTAVAEQASQNSAVQATDATTATVTSTVATLAGQQVVSVQLVEQSPVSMDQVLLRDLLADLAMKTDTFVLTNNVANKRGLLNVSGINAVTYTDASPTVGELYSKLADGIQQVHTGRFLPPDTIVMHPRRWAWMLAAVDSAGRPFVVPSAQGPANSAGLQNGVVSQGVAGQIQGLDVVLDANMPVNLGAGTNEDRIIVMRADDHILYESTPKAEAFREPLAAQLSILLRVYNYVATAFERYPKSTSVISGTGLVSPVF